MGNQNKTTFIGPGDVVEVFADPRFLVVSVSVSGLRFFVVSAHDPYCVGTRGSIDGCNSWWDCLEDKVRSLGCWDNLVVFIDANGRVGSVASEGVGSWQADGEDHNGSRLRRFVDCFGLCIPSTFEGVHRGPGCTFCHNSGSVHRIDYVLVPCSWFRFGGTTWVDKSVDIGCSVIYHWAVV